MKKILKDYFSFNSRERVSILLLCCLIVFFWLLPYWYAAPIVLPETKVWQVAKMDSPIATTDTKTERLVMKAPMVKTSLFTFNPNEISADGWRKLGVSERTINTILNYRQKGGRFRVAADLKKIYTLSASKAEELMPFVQLPEEPKPSLSVPKEIPKKWSDSIYINQVSAQELLLIPGFTKLLAARMVKFRDKMGGFKSAEQVQKTYGLNDSLYQAMLPWLVIKE